MLCRNSELLFIIKLSPKKNTVHNVRLKTAFYGLFLNSVWESEDKNEYLLTTYLGDLYT